MEQIWNAILDLTAQFVIPDWGAAVGLIPIGIVALIVLFLAWLLWQAATLGPKRRGKARVRPVPPEGVHMPGGSLAPIFGATGTALLLFGLVWGPVVTFLGVSALLMALLYWGREAMRDYDHLTNQAHGAVVVYRPPPQGVHIPAPSFRPILAAIALFVLFYGLVFGGWLLPIAILMLVITLAGWLRDARSEYRLVEAADATGHLEPMPAPSFPTGTLVLFGALFLLGIILNSGLIPPKSAAGAAAGSPAPSGSAAASGPAADVTVTGQNFSYTTTELTAMAGKTFTLAFVNQDGAVPHNVAIHEGSPTGKELFKGEIFTGVATKVYSVPALNPGTYAFVCSVHPNMTGTLTVK